MTGVSHLLSVDDLDGPQVRALLDRAEEHRARRSVRHTGVRHGMSGHVGDELAGRTVALLFEKPSTRTRVSFQVAVNELGGHPLVLSSDELQLGRGETIADTATVLSRYVHAIVIRTFGHDRLEEFAANATVPVINGLTDLEHPCQALADLQTLRQSHPDLTGRSIAYVGDGNNVLHSLVLAAVKVGVSVRIAHPDGYGPTDAVLTRATQLAATSGAEVTVTDDPVTAVTGADAVYTDVWTSMGQETESAGRLAAFAGYQVTPALFAHAAEGAIFMHCLPVHRGQEVHASVIDGPASRVFDQAENRLHMQSALLASLIGDRL